MRVKCSEDEEHFLNVMYYFSWNIFPYSNDGLQVILVISVAQSKWGFSPIPVFSSDSWGIQVLMRL